jgi:acyl transferase domain-containing protein
MWGADAALLEQTSYTQPALFSLEVALAALWRSWGVEPGLVAGHSIGELAAAYVAGVFSLDDAARLVAARGTLIQALPPGGAMVSIGAPEREVAAVIEPFGAEVSVAAVNGPESVVVSGAEPSVLAVADRFAACGARTKRLSVSHAFHSARMDPMLAKFRRVAESVTYHEPRVTMVSCRTGATAGPEVRTAEYWVAHVREAVRFADGVRALHAARAARFLELGPKATLLGLVPECLPLERDEDVVLWPSLRAERSEAEAVLEALGGYYAHGGEIDWAGVFAGGGRHVQLPTYPWQRERHWVDGERLGRRGGDPTAHPLLGARLLTAGTEALYESLLSRGEHPWLYDHRIAGRAFMPGAALVDLVRAAAEHRFDGTPAEVLSFVVLEPLELPERGSRRVQVVIKEERERWKALVYSQSAEGGEGVSWTLHASADVRHVEESPASTLDLATLRSRCGEVLDVDELHEEARALGLEYGRAFRGLVSLRRGSGEAVAEVRLPEGIENADAYGVHPALLEAAFRAALGVGPGSGNIAAWLRFGMERVTVREEGARHAAVHVQQSTPDAASEGPSFDVTLADGRGRVLVEVRGLRATPGAELGRAKKSVARELYVVEWPEAAGPSEGALPAGRWLVVGSQADRLVRAVEGRIVAAGRTCLTVEASSGEELPAAEHVVCVWSRTKDDGRVEDSASAARRVAIEGLAIVQALVTRERAPRLWWVTQGAVATVPGEPVEEAIASVWGLGRTVIEEHPELECRLVDVEAGDAGADAVVRELSARDDETETAWRSRQRRVARLARAPGADRRARDLRTGGTALVTGGLGELGLHVARWLAARGMKHLVLTGRRGNETPGATKAITELEKLGARVTVAAVDASNRDALRVVLAAIPPEMPLRGVVHAAGVLDDGALTAQSAERFSGVMAPKVDGALHLDALTRDADIDFFVLFSSATGTFGSAGQAPYTAANAVLDALASRRRAEGRPAQSLAWGMWTDTAGQGAGMSSRLTGAQRGRLHRGGLGAVTPSQGIALFEAALERSEAQLLPVPIRLNEARRAFAGSTPPLWRTLVPPRHRRGRGRGFLLDELSGLSEQDRPNQLRVWLESQVIGLLGHGNTDGRTFFEMGMDSLKALELRKLVSHALGRARLPGNVVVRHPTVPALADYLNESLVIPYQRPGEGNEADWVEITL